MQRGSSPISISPGALLQSAGAGNVAVRGAEPDWGEHSAGHVRPHTARLQVCHLPGAMPATRTCCEFRDRNYTACLVNAKALELNCRV